ncbi:MAG: energy-coupling factor ABC transporter ATP-binding protein [candidate division NC10 bacterium]|nr:energy-coupling factor ABC transporter ATP-binding protein [candidate division NC10 bacterium]
MTRIALEGVTFAYAPGVPVLRGISLTLGRGATALVGPNGAGKSTLAKHLNGILRPDSGRILLDGQDIRPRSISRLARSVGYVFQDPDEQIFQPMVWEEVAAGPRALGVSGAALDERVGEALERTGLGEVGRANPHDLALAERRRVAVAAVLAMATPALVLDEPTMGQDAQGVDLIVALIRDLVEEGRTLLAITHDMDLVAELFPRVVFLSDGRVLAEGPPVDLLASENLLAQAGVHEPAALALGRALRLPEPTPTEAHLVQRLRGSARRASAGEGG